LLSAPGNGIVSFIQKAAVLSFDCWTLSQSFFMDVQSSAAAKLSAIESALQDQKKKIRNLIMKFMVIFFITAGLSGWFLFNNYLLNLLFVIPLFIACVILLMKLFKKLLKFESEYEILKEMKRKTLLRNGDEFIYFRTG
jgi:hypothetical protein